MQPIRVKTVQESDLRMLGNLARNIQRVLPVTQADIDAAAALGNNWVVWKVFEVTEPLDNMRGGTQLIIRQNSIQPGQNVRRVIFVSGPGGQTVIVRGSEYIALPDAIANSLEYLKAFGGTEQRNIPAEYTQVNYVTNTAQTAVDTGLQFDSSKNYEIEYRGRAVTGSWYVLQARETPSSAIYGLSGSTATGNFLLAFAGGQTSPTTVLIRGGTRIDHIWYIKGTINNGTLTLYVKDEITGEEETVTGTYDVSTSALSAKIGLLGNFTVGTPPQLVGINNDVYMTRIKENGVTIMDYVPARQGATAGFYDKVSGTFKTAVTPENLSADGNTVPTPDAPMDIVSNNGALKVRILKRLPDGYKEVEYLESTGEEYIDLGYALSTASDDVEVDIQLLDATSVTNIFGARQNTSARVYTLATNGEYWRWGWKNNSTVSDVTTDLNKHVLRVDHTNDTLSLDGVVVERKGGAVTDITTPVTATLFAIHAASGSDYYFGALKVFGYKKWTNGVLAQNLVPCRRKSDNVLGMYDLVTDTFLTNKGDGTFIAGADIPDYEIYTDGTVETINVHGKNLFNKDLVPNENKYISKNNGSLTSPSTGEFRHSDYIEIKGNTEYYVGITKARSSSAGLAFYDDTKTYISGVSLAELGDNNNVVTSPANAKYIRFSFRVDAGYDTNWETSVYFCVNGTLSSFEPYFDGGTATAEILLKVGDYEDVQEILSGAITRNVGFKVLDGSESWTLSSVANTYLVDSLIPDNDFSVSAPACVCSHFIGATPNKTASEQGDDSIKVGYSNAALRYHTVFLKSSNFANVSELTSWLADQYNAGQPVIIVYPLATPTTESVAGQAMQVQQGDNIVEITQASLDNLELEAKYQAAVTLTIQEVQDANLDPNVEVTIN